MLAALETNKQIKVLKRTAAGRVTLAKEKLKLETRGAIVKRAYRQTGLKICPKTISNPKNGKYAAPIHSRPD